MPVDWYLNWSALLVVETDCSQIASAETRFLQLFQDLMVFYFLIFAQAHYCLSGCDTSDSYGKKLLLFLKWKCMEAKVFWRHSIILSECQWIYFCCKLDLFLSCKSGCSILLPWSRTRQGRWTGQPYQRSLLPLCSWWPTLREQKGLLEFLFGKSCHKVWYHSKRISNSN